MTKRKNYGFLPAIPIMTGIVILAVLTFASIIAGNIFFKDITSSLKAGFSFTNPFLWVIVILAFMLLMRRRDY